MSAENPQKTFGIIVALAGIVYFLIAACQIIFSYSELLAISTNHTFDEKLSTFSMLLEFLTQRMFPISVVALCLGGITYPQQFSSLLRAFTLSMGGLLVVLNCYYWTVHPKAYCGGATLTGCVTSALPTFIMIIFMAVMAKEVKKTLELY